MSGVGNARFDLFDTDAKLLIACFKGKMEIQKKQGDIEEILLDITLFDFLLLFSFYLFNASMTCSVIILTRASVSSGVLSPVAPAGGCKNPG